MCMCVCVCVCVCTCACVSVCVCVCVCMHVCVWGGGGEGGVGSVLLLGMVQSPAMSTFSPVGSRSSDGVCVCGWNELEVCTTMAYPHISSLCTMPVLYTSTHTHASSNHLRTGTDGAKSGHCPITNHKDRTLPIRSSHPLSNENGGRRTHSMLSSGLP